MARFVMDRQAEKLAQAEQLQLEDMAKERAKLEADLAGSTSALDAIYNRLSAPPPDFTPKPEATWGDAAQLLVGGLSGMGDGAANFVRGGQMERAAQKSAVDQQAYAAARSGDAMRADRMEQKVGRQQAFVDRAAESERGLRTKLQLQGPARDLEAAQADYTRIVTAEQKAAERQQKLEDEVKMKEFEASLNSEANKLRANGLNDQQISDYLTRKYLTDPALKTQLDEYQAIRLRQEINQSDQMFPLKLQDQQIKNNRSLLELNNYPAEFKARMDQIYGNLDLARKRYELSLDQNDAKAVMGWYSDAIKVIDDQLKIVDNLWVSGSERKTKDADGNEVAGLSDAERTYLNSRRQNLSDERKRLADEKALAGRLKKKSSSVDAALAGAGFKEGQVCTDNTDCSLFARRFYNAQGIKIPDGTSNQVRAGREVKSIEDLQPGDALFFDTVKNDPDGVGHVGVYLGGGRFAHASSTGKRGPSRNKGLQYKYRIDTLARYKFKPVAIRRFS
jgi:cell wall-associated NlpC family hydrolase